MEQDPSLDACGRSTNHDFSAFHGTQMFITFSERASHRSLSFAI